MGKLTATTQKTCGSEPVEDQIPVSLVATRFHRVEEVQVGKLAPTWGNSQPQLKKTCGSEPVVDQIPGSLVATRFPSCRGSASWETRTHMGKLAATV